MAAVALIAASCSMDSSPATPGTTTSGQGSGGKTGSSKLKPVERPTTASGSLGSADGDASVKPDAATRVSTGRDMPAVADEDAGTSQPSNQSTPADAAVPSNDAGTAKDAKDAGSGQPPGAPGNNTTVMMPQTGNPECARAKLREKADVYLQAMASNDPSMLRVHPKLRFTENGQDQQLGAGIWLRRGRATFARHALDEARCSTLTQAVLSTVTGRIVFGGRLLYSDGQLLEVETQSVPEGATIIMNIDAIPPVGSDPWVNEVPSDVRMPRERLMDYGQQYFDAASGGAMVPAASADCRRRQNGAPMAMMGSCTIAPGSSRFEQRRFAVIDDVAGIATATVLYENHLGFYLFKMYDAKMQSIEVIGGATVVDSGW